MTEAADGHPVEPQAAQARQWVRVLAARPDLAAFCLGLLLRLALLVWLIGRPLQPDAIHYHRTALALLSGAPFEPFYPPGLPLFLAAVYRVAGAHEWVGRLAMLAWYALAAGLLHQVGRALGQRRAASWAAVWLAVFPGAVWLSVEPLTQMPAAALLLGVVWLTLRIANNGAAHSSQARWAVLLGLALGWLTLTRPSSVLFFGLAPLYLVWRGRAWRAALLGIVTGGLLVVAWLGYAYQLTGRFVAVNDANSYNLFIGNNPFTPLYKTWWLGSHGAGEEGVAPGYSEQLDAIRALPPAQQQRAFRQAALEHILDRPDLFALRTANRVRSFFAFDTLAGASLRALYGLSTPLALLVIALDALLYIALGCLALAWLCGLGARLPGPHAWLLFGAMLAYAVPYFFSFAHPTYHFPILPLLALPAGAALDGLLHAGRAPLSTLSPRRRMGLGLSLALFALVQVEWVVMNWGRV